MPKILLFSRDPGGANTVVPLAGPLRAKGYEVFLYGKDTAMEVYKRYGLEGKDIAAEVTVISPGSIRDFLSDLSPDILITGTSAEDMTERYMWKEASGLGIFSMAILDQWLNYGIRFSKYGVSGMRDYKNNKKLDYVPSKVLVMDEKAREEAVSEGVDPEAIVVTGQPHFKTVLEKAERLSQGEIYYLRDSMGAGEKDKVIVFVSEPISQDYGKAEKGNTLGYDEMTIFSEVEKSLEVVSRGFPGNFIIVVRPHPREKEEKWSDIAGKKVGKLRFEVDRSSSSLTLASSSDLVVGMSSMLLIEAAILKKPVISVQIGLSCPDPFILSKRGSLSTVTEYNELERRINSVLTGNNTVGCDFDFIKDAAERIVSLVEENIWRS